MGIESSNFIGGSIYERQSNAPGVILVITGPSSVGKTEAAKMFMQRNPHFNKLITNTSRAPREGELNEVDYHFKTEEEFEDEFESGEMVEQAVFGDNYYGTPKSEVLRIFRGESLVSVMEMRGAAHFKDNIASSFDQVTSNALIDRTIIAMLGIESAWDLRSRIKQRDGQDKKTTLSRFRDDKLSWKMFGLLFDNILLNKEGRLIETLVKMEEIVNKKRETLLRPQRPCLL